MIKKFGMENRVCTDISDDNDLDDFDSSVFLLWKTELQKELPTFWESFHDVKNGYNQDIILGKTKMIN